MELKQLEYESTYTGQKHNIVLDVGTYTNDGNIYVGLVIVDEDGDYEPYADLTTNLDILPKWYAFIDVNNLENAREFIEKNKLGKDTGHTMQSGYVTYPLYKFDEERLKELSPELCAKYEEEAARRRKDQAR